MKPDYILLNQRQLLKPFTKYLGKILAEVSCWKLFCNADPDDECDCNLDLLFRDKSILSLSIKEDGQSIEANPTSFTNQSGQFLMTHISMNGNGWS